MRGQGIDHYDGVSPVLLLEKLRLTVPTPGIPLKRIKRLSHNLDLVFIGQSFASGS